MLTRERLQHFWREHQKPGPPAAAAPGASEDDASARQLEEEAARLFARHSGDARTLSVDAFQQLLLSPANSAVCPRRLSEICDDMTQPLSHYFIASSHNTYVTGNQLNSASSADMYRRVLLMGCRCVEIDCFDGPNGEPIVYHKNTAVTRIPMRGVLEAIAD